MIFRIVLGSLFVASSCLAQSDSAVSFSINTYLPLYHSQRTLNIAPYLNYNNSVKKDNEIVDSISQFSDDGSANGNGGINTRLFYRNQLQASDIVLETRFSLFGNTHYDRVVKEGEDGSDSVMNSDAYGSLYEDIFQEYRHRFYMPFGRNLFAQWIIRPQLGLSQQMQTTKQNLISNPGFISQDSCEYSAWTNQISSSNQSINLPIQVCFGFGSVCDVTSAAISMNIYDRILGKGVSENPQVAHRVKKYANSIDVLRNKRVFDSRESLIADVAELCDILQPDSGTKLTPHQVMEIADEWQYGQNQVRMTGLEIAIGPQVTGYALNQDFIYKYGSDSEIGPRINFSDYNWNEMEVLQSDSKSNHKYYSASLVLITNLQYAKPLSRKFQYDGSLLYSFDIFDNSAPTVDLLLHTSPQDHLNHFTLDNTLSWFANIRTTINLHAQYAMTIGRAPDVFAYKFETQLSANYYVFPKLKISGSLMHIYSYQDDTRYRNVRPHTPNQQNIFLALSMAWDSF